MCTVTQNCSDTMFPFHCDIGAIITSACDNYNCLRE